MVNTFKLMPYCLKLRLTENPRHYHLNSGSFHAVHRHQWPVKLKATQVITSRALTNLRSSELDKEIQDLSNSYCNSREPASNFDWYTARLTSNRPTNGIPCFTNSIRLNLQNPLLREVQSHASNESRAIILRKVNSQSV